MNVTAVNLESNLFTTELEKKKKRGEERYHNSAT